MVVEGSVETPMSFKSLNYTLVGFGRQFFNVDNIFRRSQVGPNIWILCKKKEESVDHLFIFYTFSRIMWQQVTKSLGVKKKWGFDLLKTTIWNGMQVMEYMLKWPFHVYLCMGFGW